ncbi:hypothetical protein E2C01_008122 [Portunus trituberculatus]|uniref:Uncharacterized protein n=1 Tax=Portunus trituberculatus TaxID=210409 RepID=A0A5B7D1Y9_PORTR|nr:hypothetical protein [Portunus trituberculatus]
MTDKRWRFMDPDVMMDIFSRVSKGKAVNSWPQAPHRCEEMPPSQVPGVSGRPLQLATTLLFTLGFFSDRHGRLPTSWSFPRLLKSSRSLLRKR